MAKSNFFIQLALIGFLAPWPSQVLARWRQVRHRCLRAVDLELRRSKTIVALGVSGSGKSTLLKLLAAGTPEAAGDFFMDPSLRRPMQVIDGDAIRAAAVPNDMDLQEVKAWGVESSPRSARSMKWKARCAHALFEYPGLLLLDEVLDVMPRPLRLRFAADICFAAMNSDFAVVSATHCLAADISWLRESCQEVWILEHGELRCLCPQTQRDFEEIERYAALRCRMGSVNP